MPQRTISTRIAIEGESEYKRSVANINSTLGALKAELGAVKAEYNANANSMEALRAKGESMCKVQDAQVGKLKELSAALENARRMQQEYAAKVEEANQKVLAAEKRLESMTGKSNRAVRDRAELTASLEEYRGELAQVEKYNEAAQRGVNNWSKQLNNAKRDLANLNLDIQKNDQYLDEAKKSADGCATSIDQYGKKVKNAGGMVVDSSGAISALAGAIAASGVKAAFDEVAAAITSCIDASTRFESAMTGVYKTVDGSGTQLEAITEGIRKMALEIPASATVLAGVAEAAGQLGIATDDILDFTRVMTDLGNATNLSADEAATAFARFANITGMAAEDYGRLGSAVVALGNHFATTESEIAAMATRLAAAGSVSGLSEPEIMAVATALSSVGVEAEAGGSGISKLMKQFEVMVATGSDKLAGFAAVAGMNAAQFSEAWRADAVGALSQFIEGLGRMDAAGGSSVATLEQLGVTEARMSDAVLRLAGAGDLLTRAVETSNGAWAENTALTDEASKLYETTESKLALMGNAFEELKISVGDVFAPAVREAAEGGADLLIWASNVVKEYPAVVGVISAVVAALGVLTAATVGYSVAVTLLAPAIDAVKKVFEGTTRPTGLIVVAITAAVAAFGAFSAAMKGAGDETRSWSDATREAVSTWREETGALESAAGSAASMVETLRDLMETEEKTAADKQAILGLVRALNEAVPTLSLAYDEQTDSLNMTTEAIERMALALDEQARIESAQETLAALYVERKRLAEELTDATEGLSRAQADFAEGQRTLVENTEENNNQLIMLQTWAGVCKDKVAKLTAEQEANEAQIAAVSEEYDKLTVVIEDADVALSGAAAVAALTTAELKEMEEATGAQGKAAKDLAGQMDALSGAFAEQERNGSLSVGTMLSLIDAGYAAALSIDQETGAVRLNAEAFLALASAKLDEQMAGVADSVRENRAKAMEQEGAAAVAAAGGYLDLAFSYRTAADAANGAADNAEANLAVLQKLKDGLGMVVAGGWSSRAGGSSGSKNSAKKGKTPAELELEAYREAVKELDHLRAMDELSDEAYYQRKAALGEQCLKHNLEERRKLDEELYGYEKNAYDRELALLDQSLKYKEITYVEHRQGLARLQAEYLTEGTEAWKENERLQQEDRQKSYEERLSALDRGLEDGRMTLQQHLEGVQALEQEAQSVSADTWRENRKKQEANRRSAYDGEVADQRYYLDMGIISEEEYYAELRRLRDEYLEEDSKEWRRANVELHQYEERLRKEALDALKRDLDERLKALKEANDKEVSAIKDAYGAEKDALKDAYDAQKAAAKDAYNAKKDAIKGELDLEKERLNGVLASIDAEIQARRQLREDEDQDGAIAAARKRLDAAKTELAFARTDEDKRQWSDEIVRLEKALQEAVQKKEDTEFFRQKELEKEAVRDQMDAAQREADGKLDAAAKDYDSLAARQESEYQASVAKLEADYQAKLAQAEAAYLAAAERLERDYEAAKARLERDYAARAGGGGGGTSSSGGREYSDEVRAIAEANGVDLSVGQSMYNMNQWNKGDPDYTAYASVKSAKALAGAASGMVSAVVAGAVLGMNKSVQNITRNNAANVTIHQASSLTSGQITAAVRRTLEEMGK